MGRRKKKFKIHYNYRPEHSVYLILGIIIFFLGMFVINNCGRCRVFSLSSKYNGYKIANGILVLSDTKNILKINNIDYTGKIDNVASVTLTVCVDVDKKCNSVATMSSNAAEGMDFKEYLGRISIDVNESADKPLAITKKIKKRIEDNLYLKLDILTLDGEVIYDLVKIEVDKEYINNKIFY